MYWIIVDNAYNETKAATYDYGYKADHLKCQIS